MTLIRCNLNLFRAEHPSGGMLCQVAFQHWTYKYPALYKKEVVASAGLSIVSEHLACIAYKLSFTIAFSDPVSNCQIQLRVSSSCLTDLLSQDRLPCASSAQPNILSDTPTRSDQIQGCPHKTLLSVICFYQDQNSSAIVLHIVLENRVAHVKYCKGWEKEWKRNNMKQRVYLFPLPLFFSLINTGNSVV